MIVRQARPGYDFTKEITIQFSPKGRGLRLGRFLMQKTLNPQTTTDTLTQTE